jgi:hypothetical protein
MSTARPVWWPGERSCPPHPGTTTQFRVLRQTDDCFPHCAKPPLPAVVCGCPIRNSGGKVKPSQTILRNHTVQRREKSNITGSVTVVAQQSSIHRILCRPPPCRTMAVTLEVDTKSTAYKSQLIAEFIAAQHEQVSRSRGGRSLMVSMQGPQGAGESIDTIRSAYGCYPSRPAAWDIMRCCTVVTAASGLTVSLMIHP